METYDAGSLRFHKLTVGPYANNVYILQCRASGEGVIIDASFEVERILAAARGTRVRYILQTHCHMDHVAGLPDLKQAIAVPVGIHPADEEYFGIKGDFPLLHGQTVEFGQCRLQLLHTPGHSPGGVCFRFDHHFFCGDTLFPGGPGKTWSAADFLQIIASITTHIYTLPDDTVLYPGHGLNTTVGASKAEYAVFAAQRRRRGLYGDVLWLRS